MVAPLGSPQPIFVFPSLEAIPDIEDDIPVPGQLLGTVGPCELPKIVFGAGTFSSQYNPDTRLMSDAPVRTIRLALRYGIDAFDTSAYYGPSEIVLGAALKTLAPEFPRSSYKLMTKCGRYGSNAADFDYSPATIRASVMRSLKRLGTPYLDTVYLHDIEFVATQVQPRPTGDPTVALREEKPAWGLADGDEAKVCGKGDQKVLEAIVELRKMQDEGLIRDVGITGYPLATLLRFAILVLHTPPYKPLDVLLSYSHLSLQNCAFHAFVPHFLTRAKIPQLLAASPFSMGLLTPAPPVWHPAPPPMRAATQAAVERCSVHEGGLPDVALGYTFRMATELGVPTVVGFSTPAEVHESVRVWRELRGEGNRMGMGERRLCEEEVKQLFLDAGMLEWSWASP